MMENKYILGCLDTNPFKFKNYDMDHFSLTSMANGFPVADYI
jgi:hypothetical protein